MDNRGIPIVAPSTTPRRSHNNTPSRYDFQSSPFVLHSRKHDMSLLEAYDSFAEACFLSPYDHARFSEDMHCDVRDMLKSEYYSAERSNYYTPTNNPHSGMFASPVKRTRSPHLTIDPSQRAMGPRGAASSLFEVTTPIEEDLFDGLDQMMAASPLSDGRDLFSDLQGSSKAYLESTPALEDRSLDLSEQQELEMNVGLMMSPVTPIKEEDDSIIPTTVVVPSPQKEDNIIPNEINKVPVMASTIIKQEEEAKRISDTVDAKTAVSTYTPDITANESSKVSVSADLFDGASLAPSQEKETPTQEKATTTKRKRSRKTIVDPSIPRKMTRSQKRLLEQQQLGTAALEHKLLDGVVVPKRRAPRSRKPISKKSKSADLVVQEEGISTANKSEKDKALMRQEEALRKKREEQRKAYIQKEINEILESFPELAEQYKLLDRTGSGTFSKVYKAKDLLRDLYVDWTEEIDQLDGLNTDYVAIKMIMDNSSPDRMASEIKRLNELRNSPGITPLITAFRNQSTVFVVLPFIECDHFDEFYTKMTVADIKCYITRLLIGLQSAHEKGIMHRDIKPGNFLYNVKAKIGYLADFGLAQKVDPYHKIRENKNIPSSDHTVDRNSEAGYYMDDTRPPLQADRSGTRGFRAPEVLLRYRYQTTSVDIWAVGVILLSFLSGRYPFFEPEDDADALLELAHLFGMKNLTEFTRFYGLSMRANIPTVPEEELDLADLCRDLNQEGHEKWDQDEYLQAIDLMKQCLQLIHTKRPTANEALNHPFLSNIK